VRWAVKGVVPWKIGSIDGSKKREYNKEYSQPRRRGSIIRRNYD